MKESMEKTGKYSFGTMGKYGGKLDLTTNKFIPFHLKPLDVDIKD